MMPHRRYALVALAIMLLLAPDPIVAQAPGAAKPYQVEWVYRVRYGHQAEWWRLFRTYQIAELDEEQRRGYVRSYSVVCPGLHTSEDARWDYRVVITYNGYEGSTHEGEVERALFPDRESLQKAEDRRWDLTANHWDLPIREIDPHAVN